MSLAIVLYSQKITAHVLGRHPDESRVLMPNKHNQFIGYKVYDAQRLIHRALEVSLKDLGITPGQWNLMNQLDRAGALTQKGIAERTRKEQATITRYLDTLERKNLIVRTRDTTDRRAYIITLTNEAKALLKKAVPVAEEAAEKLVVGIQQEEIDLFLDVLERLKNNAETYVEEKTARS